MEFSGPFLFRVPFSDKGPVPAVEQPQVLQRESQPGFFAKVGELSMGFMPTSVTGTFGSHCFSVYRESAWDIRMKAMLTYVFFGF